MENLDKHYSSSGQDCYWLEIPMVSGNMQVYNVYSYFRDVKGLSVSNDLGVRPVIEVLKSNIAN